MFLYHFVRHFHRFLIKVVLNQWFTELAPYFIDQSVDRQKIFEQRNDIQIFDNQYSILLLIVFYKIATTLSSSMLPVLILKMISKIFSSSI